MEHQCRILKTHLNCAYLDTIIAILHQSKLPLPIMITSSFCCAHALKSGGGPGGGGGGGGGGGAGGGGVWP